jgi:hypothetical protein
MKKKKIAFAMIMGIITTGIISFSLIAINLGFAPHFAEVLLKSWAIAYCIAIPAILVIAPRVEALVEVLFKPQTAAAVAAITKKETE